MAGVGACDMKQVLQDLKGGETFIADVPRPRLISGHVVVQTQASLISSGTERMLRDFGQAGLISKTLQQPDKVRQACQKIKTDGIASTYQAISNKLDQLLPLGYCNAGVVLEAHKSSRWKQGQRIVSNGYHAEYASVPENLCAAIPDCVSDEEASFTITGAIAMQGVRLATPQIGEVFAVIGLGLIGLLAVQILKANGCRVIGIDPDEKRRKLAQRFGAETRSKSVEVDGVLIAASTKSNKVVSEAAQMCRKRGRIILLGQAGLNLSRADFYEKEITFQVSCSYGPGRYDQEYEQGQDYPAGFVRWTAQRNMEAVLQLMTDSKLSVKPMISHRFAVAEAEKAYALIDEKTPSLGILIKYPCKVAEPQRRIIYSEPKGQGDAPNVAFIGAGYFASSILAPAFSNANANLICAVSQGGISSYNLARKFKFAEAVTDIKLVLENDKINTVVIATRHNSHAEIVTKSLQAGKHVFVEKPLALTLRQVDHIEQEVSNFNIVETPVLMVDFNRRFAPLVQRMKVKLDELAAPKSMIMTINAGAIESKHWTQNLKLGGGRIIGEVCHFIDLLRYLCGYKVEHVSACPMRSACSDTATINLQFADGSIGTIHYFSNGHNGVSKERVEVFCDGKVMQLDNFRKLKTYGSGGSRSHRLLRQDKGHQQCIDAFCSTITQGGSLPIPLDEIFEVSRTAIKAAELVQEGICK